MQYPKLKFGFDPNGDFEFAWVFYNHPKRAGRNFWLKGALKQHDELFAIKKAKDKKAFLSNYVSSRYNLHFQEFEKQKKAIMSLYKRKELLFFQTTNKIFKNHPWPKGKYIAYLSIFDFCPRFLDDKTFFLFMYDNNDGLLSTIFHEMLHFIFYDYCLTKYPKIFKKQNTERGSFWEMAEVFNPMIQQTPAFAKLHGSTDKIGYPDLKSKFTAAKKIWQGDIDDWIINYVKKTIH